MDYEQAHLDSLNKVISIQNELITYLKAEIERLKASQIVTTPSGPLPYTQPGLVFPNTQPFVPGNPTPWYPSYPYGTSGDVGQTRSGTIISTDPIHPGVIQANVS